MKYLLILFALFTIKASAQVDSSQLYIEVQMKQKFALDMWPPSPTVQDARVLDTLRKAIGSGSVATWDSVTLVKFKAGTYLRMIEKICDQAVAGYYIDGPEFFQAPLTASGYSGLLTLIDWYISQVGNVNRPAALYMKQRVLDLIQSKKNVVTTIRETNRVAARSTIVYN